ANGELDCHWRYAINLKVFAYGNGRIGLAESLQRSGKLAAGAIKKNKLAPGLHTQHARQVMAGSGVQLNRAAGYKCLASVKSRYPQRRPPALVIVREYYSLWSPSAPVCSWCKNANPVRRPPTVS